MSVATLESVAIEGQVRSGFETARTIGRNRRIVVPRYGGPEVMTIIEEPIPEPRTREIRSTTSLPTRCCTATPAR